jgi:hypothetical protein
MSIVVPNNYFVLQSRSQNRQSRYIHQEGRDQEGEMVVNGLVSEKQAGDIRKDLLT